MNHNSSPQFPQRRNSPMLTYLLLGGILTCLVVIIAVLLLQEPDRRADGSREESPVSHRVAKANEPAPPPTAHPPKPKPVGKPERIRDVLLEGRTYDVRATASLYASVRDKAWGMETIVYLNYLAELHFDRTIEKNDGHRVEEVRRIHEASMIKVTSTVDFRFAELVPGQSYLAAIAARIFTSVYPDGGRILVQISEAWSCLKKLVTESIRSEIDDQTTRIAAAVDSLRGLQFRVVYVDGLGVTELVPLNRSLTEDERDFLYNICAVSDAYILPDEDIEVGGQWEVPAEAFTDLLPPSWRGRPRGSVVVKRTENYTRAGKEFARLTVTKGVFDVDATDERRERLGSATVSGDLIYDVTEGHVAEATLKGEASIEEASRDHLLLETRFEMRPRIEMVYECKLLPE